MAFAKSMNISPDYLLATFIGRATVGPRLKTLGRKLARKTVSFIKDIIPGPGADVVAVEDVEVADLLEMGGGETVERQEDDMFVVELGQLLDRGAWRFFGHVGDVVVG